jgi:hypothetical protein
MLVVTTRTAVRERLGAVSTRLGLPSPTFVGRVEEALESGIDSPVLLLDLGSCCKDESLEHVLRTWEAYRPGGEVVVFTPLIDREAELKAAVTLVRVLRLAETRVMTASDFYRDEVWRNLGELGQRSALESELRRELVAAVQELGRRIRAEPVVLQILHDAPRYADISAAASTALGRVRVRADTQRKALWKLLRRSGQMPASWLLLVFRVLWYVKLREKGWSTDQIAHFLSFPSARHLRMTLRRRFGVGVGELKRVRYDDVLRWAATLVTSEHADLARQSVRALVEPLLARTDVAGVRTSRDPGATKAAERERGSRRRRDAKSRDE